MNGSTTNHQEDREHSHSHSNIPFVIGYPVNSVNGYPVVASPAALSNVPFPRSSFNDYRNNITSNNREVSGEGQGTIRSCLWVLPLLFVFLFSFFVLGWQLRAMQTTDKPNFLVDSMVVSPLNISGSQLTANWTLAISIENPNKFSRIHYDNLEVTLIYNKTQFLSKTMVPMFHQRPKNRTTLFTTPRAFGQGLSYSVLEKLVDDQRNGVINFDLALSAQLTFYWRFTKDEAVYKSNLVCGNVRLGFPEVGQQGTMVGDPYECSYTDFHLFID